MKLHLLAASLLLPLSALAQPIIKTPSEFSSLYKSRQNTRAAARSASRARSQAWSDNLARDLAYGQQYRNHVRNPIVHAPPPERIQIERIPFATTGSLLALSPRELQILFEQTPGYHALRESGLLD